MIEQPQSPGGWIGRQVVVVVDRPLGTEHPDGGLFYEVNYGSIPGTVAGDGEPVDAYVVGVDHPVGIAVGIVVGVVVRHDDVEYKLVVTPGEAHGWTARRIADVVSFQERFFATTVLVG